MSWKYHPGSCLGSTTRDAFRIEKHIYKRLHVLLEASTRGAALIVGGFYWKCHEVPLISESHWHRLCTSCPLAHLSTCFRVKCRYRVLFFLFRISLTLWTFSPFTTEFHYTVNIPNRKVYASCILYFVCVCIWYIYRFSILAVDLLTHRMEVCALKTLPNRIKNIYGLCHSMYRCVQVSSSG